MAIIPQIITEDRASGAQVIDGSLRFDSTKKQYLTRTPSSAGNQKTFTLSGWFKLSSITVSREFFVSGTDNTERTRLLFQPSDAINFYNRTGNTVHDDEASTALFRDTSSFYHVVISIDNANTTGTFYVNGESVHTFTTVNTNSYFNSTTIHYIGGQVYNDNNYYNGYISQLYLIDGQALDPSYFGYTDPLTNTWRPKKYEGTFGTNGFWLPFDGSSPIGEDKSGNGNNWTPVNFGGSNSIEKATGALPILNTVNGGNTATSGIRTDAYASNLVLALPLIGSANDVSNQINSGSTTKTVTVNGAVVDLRDSIFYDESFVFDGTNDDIVISSSTDLNDISGDFTIEYWVKHTGTGVYQYHFSLDNTTYIYTTWNAGSPNGPYLRARIQGDLVYEATTLDFQPNQWAHIAMVRSGTGSNNCKLFVNGNIVAQASINTAISESAENLYLGQSSDSNYYLGGNISDFRVYKGVAKYTSNFIPASTNPDILPDTPSGVAYSSELTKITDGAVAFNGTSDYLSIPNSTDFDFGSGEFTIEAFFRTANVSSQNGIVNVWGYSSNRRSWNLQIDNSTAGPVEFVVSTDGTSGTNTLINGGSVALNKWHHVAAVRTSNTLKLFLDGIEVASTSFSGTIYSNSTDPLYIGSVFGATDYMAGHISNVRIIKGTALYTSNFTPPTEPLTEVTNTKLLCCQSMTSSVVAAVTPGSITANGNAVATNFNPFNTDINTVRGQESLYCTLNPLEKNSKFTLSENNLKFTNSTNNWTGWIGGTQTFKTGRWYWEVRIDVATQYHIFGIVNTTLGSISAASTYQYAMAYQTDGRFYAENNGTFAFSSNNPTAQTVGDICSIAVDMDNKKMWLGINGQWTGGANPSIGYLANWDSTRGFTDGDTYMPVFMSYGSSGQTVNFGQKPFRFTPPDGFQPLCLNNLPRPTEAALRPDKHFKTVLWTGDDSTDRPITTGFRPDFVWVKARNQAYSNHLYDSVRGPSLRLLSNGTHIEFDQTSIDGVSSFNSDGFDVSNTNALGVNQLNTTYVAWCWKAGGNSGTFNIDGRGYATAAEAGLTAGTKASLLTGASVNTESGFSILTWTGDGTNSNLQIPHGLPSRPLMIAVKKRNEAVDDWYVAHDGLDGDNYAYRMFWGPNGTSTKNGNQGATNPYYLANQTNDTIVLNNTTTNGGGNENNITYLAYCWSEVPGFSKFAKYEGTANGGTDGPFIECGFKPAWVLIKSSDAATSWYLFDNVRGSIQTQGSDAQVLFPDTAAVEDANGGQGIDFLSNGFKVRAANGYGINNQVTYVYAAFAEAPTTNLYGGQANAR